jgi:hypothetical protein
MRHARLVALALCLVAGRALSSPYAPAPTPRPTAIPAPTPYQSPAPTATPVPPTPTPTPVPRTPTPTPTATPTPTSVPGAAFPDSNCVRGEVCFRVEIRCAAAGVAGGDPVPAPVPGCSNTIRYVRNMQLDIGQAVVP